MGNSILQHSKGSITLPDVPGQMSQKCKADPKATPASAGGTLCGHVGASGFHEGTCFSGDRAIRLFSQQRLRSSEPQTRDTRGLNLLDNGGWTTVDQQHQPVDQPDVSRDQYRIDPGRCGLQSIVESQRLGTS